MKKDIKEILSALGPFDNQRVRIRLLTKDDITERYLSWLNDFEVTKYMKSGVHETTLDELSAYCEKAIASDNNAMFAIVDKEKELHIGNIKLGNIDWCNQFADLGIMLGDRDYWGRGYGREACELLLVCAFDALNLNKVILGVHALHSSAVALYEKLGFEIEGAFKKLLLGDQQYYDKIIMGISQERYRAHKIP